MANGMDMWIHSTGLAKPVESFQRGVELRAMLQQIDQKNQAETFQQTMQVIESARKGKEDQARLDLQRQGLDLRAKEMQNRNAIAQESLRLRAAGRAGGGAGVGAARQFTPAGVYGAAGAEPPQTSVPAVDATPLPPDVPAGVQKGFQTSGDSPNFMAAQPADQISPYDMTGAADPQGLPQIDVPSVDSVIQQNPTMDTRSGQGVQGPTGGTIFQPVRQSNGTGTVTEYAVVGGVQSSRTVNEKTGSTTKWTALPGVKSAQGDAGQDPTADTYTNADGVLVKQVGGTEVPVDQMTLRGKAGSITLRPPKKVEASRISLNEDGSGTFADDNGNQVKVQAKSVSFSNGKYAVHYDVPGASPIVTEPDEQAQTQLDSLDKLGLKLKSASFNSKGQIQLQGAVPADVKPEAGTLGAMTAKWGAKEKQWRDEAIDRIMSPTPKDKAAAVLGKPLDAVTDQDMATLTADQWSEGYHKAREGFANLVAHRIETVEGVSAAKVKAMLLGTLKPIQPSAATAPDSLPPIDPSAGLGVEPPQNIPNILPTPSSAAPRQSSKAASFLDRMTTGK